MSEPTAQRTLVKSPPELWAEVSDAESLAKHLGEIGGDEIKITRIEPETTVAWEGERARGTVQIEPSGWGTKVTVSATVPEPVAPEPPAPEPEPEPVGAHAAEGGGSAEPVAVEPEPEPVAATPAPIAETPEPLTTAELLERSGFFSRMFGRSRLRGEIVEEPPAPAPEPEITPLTPVPDPEPEPDEEPDLPEPTPLPERDPDPTPPAAEVAPAAEAIGPERVEELLSDVLDSLGSAHHRPFSRQ